MTQLKIIYNYYNKMGQVQSTDHQVDSCFRNCMKYNKQKITKKTVAEAVKITRKEPTEQVITLNLKQEEYKSIEQKKGLNIRQPLETSIGYRLKTQEDTIKKQTQINAQYIPPFNSQRQMKEIEVQLDFLSATLGIQSKFSFKKQDEKGSRQRNSTGISSNNQKVTTFYQGNFHQKQSGQHTQQTTKSNKTYKGTKSNKILLNKIQSIKQKYYQRELQIQIYQNQKEYQEQINSIAKIQKSLHKNNVLLPVQSMNEISIIKGKIKNKLEQTRLKIDKSIDHSISMNPDENLPGDNILDHLQLYSRDGKLNDENQLKESSRLSKSRHEKGINKFRRQEMNKSNDRSISRSMNKQMNRSANTSQQQESFENQVSFSQYSEQSLHQIKELDQQQDEYKSNVIKERSKRQQLVSKLKSIKSNTQQSIQPHQVSNNMPQKIKNPENESLLLQMNQIQQKQDKGMMIHSTGKEQTKGHQLRNHKKLQGRSKPPDTNGSNLPKSNNILLF